jgi:hypothetical protein
MASADLRFDIRTPREARSQWHQIGSPQVRHTSFLPVHRIYVPDSCMSIGHWVIWPPPPSEPPHIRFLFVEHAFCYRLPPDLVLPLRPCRVANSSPHRASSGFAPYRSAPCWAHQFQTRRSSRYAGFIFSPSCFSVGLKFSRLRYANPHTKNLFSLRSLRRSERSFSKSEKA